MKIEPEKKYRKIATEFVFLVAGILCVAFLLNAIYQYNEERNIAIEQLNVRGNSIGELLASIAIDPLLIYDNLTLNEYVKNTSAQQDIVFAVFYDDGVAITNYLDTNKPIISDIVNDKENINLEETLKILSNSNSVSTLKFPVNFNNRRLANLVIGIDNTSIEALPFKHLINQVVISLLLAFFVGLAVYSAFIRKVSLPIKKLIHAVNNVASFIFDSEIKIKGKNEITELANTFDHMRITLRNAVLERDHTLSEMERFNINLEERVNERTQELHVLNSEMAHQAMHDPLTGLPNRILVIERLNQALQISARNNVRLAVFIIDLNNFKEVNDTLGHPAGDEILQQVAQRLPKALRQSDTVGRLGGDEFAVVLPDTEVDQAKIVAQKILDCLIPSFNLDNQPIALTASIGIAISPDHGAEQSALIRRADVAMYEAKKNDEGFLVYDPEFDLYTPKRLALMADLRHAINENELELYYQPQLNLKTGEVTCVEALIRWQHDEHGMIHPESFIYMAENSGLMNVLSDWVFNQALIDWNDWMNTGLKISIAINLSVRNLVDPDLPDRLSEIQQMHNVPGNFIKLEITESAVMSNPEFAMKIMSHPKLSRFYFAIDDFGTGYSSLSYLKRLAVHEVKIDKSFVLDMDKNEEDASIVRSVIDLSHNLGRSVLAEGVENIETLEILKNLGCDNVQGYLLSVPVAANEVPSLVKRLNQHYLKNVDSVAH